MRIKHVVRRNWKRYNVTKTTCKKRKGSFNRRCEAELSAQYQAERERHFMPETPLSGGSKEVEDEVVRAG